MSDELRPANAAEIEDALAFALRHRERKRVGDAEPIMAEIVAERLVKHLERSGFVIMRKPPVEGGAAIGRGVIRPE